MLLLLVVLLLVVLLLRIDCASVRARARARLCVRVCAVRGGRSFRCQPLVERAVALSEYREIYRVPALVANAFAAAVEAGHSIWHSFIATAHRKETSSGRGGVRSMHLNVMSSR